LEPPPPTFDEDVAFMQWHGPIEVLAAPGGGRVAVSAKWQARVMTSAVETKGASLGFVNRAFIQAGKTGTQFDNFGGEDRFWLGPEGGQFALYFAPGAKFDLAAWQVPHAMQEGEWTVKERGPSSITFGRAMKLVSYSNADFDIAVERTVRLLSAGDVASRFGTAPPAQAKWVAFETVNRITNAGSRPWTKDKGLVDVWILGMYAPSSDTEVVVPFATAGEGAVVNDRYFGKVPADRLTVRERDGYLLFKCDGQYRSKIGLGPTRAKPTLGSYSAKAQLLTLVHYDKPAAARDYVNSMWEQRADPFDGDVVNSYNDGPPAPGKPSLGGFFELETSSPAAALAPGESLVHTHTTLHLVADAPVLDPIAVRALGVSIAAIH
jgi:hypothetical protein